MGMPLRSVPPCGCWGSVRGDLGSRPAYLRRYLFSPLCRYGVPCARRPGLKVLGFQCQGVLSLGARVLRCGGVGLRGFGARLHPGCLFTKQVRRVSWAPLTAGWSGAWPLGEVRLPEPCAQARQGSVPCAHLDVGLGQLPAVAPDEFLRCRLFACDLGQVSELTRPRPTP